MKIDRVQLMLVALPLVLIADPALARYYYCAPAPVAGLGFGAALAVGAGYRALKSRFKR